MFIAPLRTSTECWAISHPVSHALLHSSLSCRPWKAITTLPGSALATSGFRQTTPQISPTHKPLVWCLKWLDLIIRKLVTSSNPTGTISNSDLDLAGGLLHLKALAQSLDTCEQTILSKTNNLDTLYLE